MFFKSFDGWTAVGNEGERKVVLAKFTRSDDEVSHYNVAALHRMRDKPSSNFSDHDKQLIRDALKEGPVFFKAYYGWNNIGRGGKEIMIASLVKASGEHTRLNLRGIHNMAANPPPKFSAFDKAILTLAAQEAPAPRRS